MTHQNNSKAAILVTGGAGYIGAHACKSLARAGYLPVAYDNLITTRRTVPVFGIIFTCRILPMRTFWHWIIF